MSRWTDEELRELITLWPTHSVPQIVKRLHRPRWAIRSKAKRLGLDGLAPHNPEHVEVKPPKRRWRGPAVSAALLLGTSQGNNARADSGTDQDQEPEASRAGSVQFSTQHKGPIGGTGL
jgi:hypothetical protein